LPSCRPVGARRASGIDLDPVYAGALTEVGGVPEARGVANSISEPFGSEPRMMSRTTG